MSEDIFRDDDPSVYTDAYLFKKLNEQFIREGKTHTVALLMKDLWQNHALFYYLAQAPNIVIGLHGLAHKDYAKLTYEECYEDLKKSLDYWYENSNRMTGNAKEITTFFSPWNHDGGNIRKACADLGLKFCNVQSGEWEGKHINSFHWWNVMLQKDEYTIDNIIDR